MDTSISIEDRKPVWMAISEFYLDTNLEGDDLERIAKVFLRSPFSLDELKAIHKYEVFPVLQINLMSPAGEWDYFDEAWLVNKISTRLTKRNWFTDMFVKMKFSWLSWMTANYWVQLSETYERLKKESH
jgi:hypothetical protein